MFVNYYMFPKTIVRNTLLSNAEQYSISYEVRSVYDTVWRIDINDSITIPYRIGEKGIYPDYSNFDIDDKLAYLCYLTRNQSGFVRYNAIDELLTLVHKQIWVYPYILKLCDEYVIRILDRIYDSLPQIINEQFVDVICLNMNNIKKGYARMISYWNVYYRKDIPNIENYVGYKIYKLLIDASQTVHNS